MTLAIASATRPKRNLGWGLAWAIGLALAAGLFLLRDQLPWAVSYPKAWIITVASWINAAMPPVVDFLFTTTRAITAVLSLPLQLALGLLSRGFQLGDRDSALAIPRLSWLGLTAAAAIAGHALGGRGLTLGHRALLPLPRAVRPMGQRHDHPCPHRRRRSHPLVQYHRCIITPVALTGARRGS